MKHAIDGPCQMLFFWADDLLRRINQQSLRDTNESLMIERSVFEIEPPLEKYDQSRAVSILFEALELIRSDLGNYLNGQLCQNMFRSPSVITALGALRCLHSPTVVLEHSPTAVLKHSPMVVLERKTTNAESWAVVKKNILLMRTKKTEETETEYRLLRIMHCQHPAIVRSSNGCIRCWAAHIKV